MPAKTPPPHVQLLRRLDGVTTADASTLRRRIHGVKRAAADKREHALAAIERDLARAEQRYTTRCEHVPHVQLPPELPITAAADEIVHAIENHQVVIVAGETGSGKTTQLPKLALRAGRGRRGLIGHTQPRRIAARSVAARIAEEMGTELGQHVGFSVRFTDQTSDATYIRLMTDGILLAEIGRDKYLSKYDTIIIDEAHERSLNIDFLIGFLTQLLPKRPDLKVIITSATIDVERFAAHFDGAPVIEVSGRTYPVDVLYRPLADYADADGEAADQVTGIIKAARELARLGAGDILVFLSGEREIRDAADALEGARSTIPGPPIEVTPLFARLSAAEQAQVFKPAKGRRIVLSTNVAETSLTVPGIRYVIDTGLARISRFSARLKVQRLPIEAISKASANQRSGRCGRVAHGTAIRLYSEEDFEARPEFTDPEILRTNLASVILTMANIGLGKISDFPFLQPPDARHIADGVGLLTELGALDERRRITETGRKMAALPIEPRLARMLLASAAYGCTADVLTIAAALSIQDPRERPLDKQAQADTYHNRFRDKTSDFMTWLNLWDYLQDQQKQLSSSAFRRLVKSEFLHYVRIREWQDIRGQLQNLVRELGIDAGGTRQHSDRIHTALLAGLLSHIGAYDERTKDYAGPRGARFAIFPGSGVSRKKPDLIMCAELVETSRLWGRDVAAINPDWVESVGGHIIKRTYAEPRWSRKQAAVVATEKVTCYGVTIIAGRTINFSSHDPGLAREVFIRSGLVEGDWDTRHEFFSHNRALLDDAEELQSRVRRRDLVVDDDELFAFYDERIPEHVVSGRHFDAWWKKAKKRSARLLHFSTDDVLADDLDTDSADFPRTWHVGATALPISYAFDPGTDRDGATVHIDLAALPAVADAPFDWHIPGHREELVAELLRTLPKPLRRHLVPVPDAAKKVLAQLPDEPNNRSLVANIIDVLAALYRLTVAHEDFDTTRLPDHLRLRFVVKSGGKDIAAGTDLAALRSQLGAQADKAVAKAGSGREATGLREFPDIDLRETVTAARGGRTVEIAGRYGLVDEGDTIGLRVYGDALLADQNTRAAVAGMLMRDLPGRVVSALDALGTQDKLVVASGPHPSTGAFTEDLTRAIVGDVIAKRGVPRTSEEYATLKAIAGAYLEERAPAALATTLSVLRAAGAAANALPKSGDLRMAASLSDLGTWLKANSRDRMLRDAGAARLPDLVRYFQAAGVRAERMATDPARDAANLSEFNRMRGGWVDLMNRYDAHHPAPEELADVRWLLQELRVHLFAPTIKTGRPVSVQRVTKKLNQLKAELV